MNDTPTPETDAFFPSVNRYSLKNEPEYDTPWISAPNDGGDVGDMPDIVDELNKLKWERDLLALLASEKPQFFNPLHAARAVELRDKILQQNAQAMASADARPTTKETTL